MSNLDTAQHWYKLALSGYILYLQPPDSEMCSAISKIK
jgi:hypothetical protein